MIRISGDPPGPTRARETRSRLKSGASAARAGRALRGLAGRFGLRGGGLFEECDDIRLVPVVRSDLGRHDATAGRDDEGCRDSPSVWKTGGSDWECSTVIGQFLSRTKRTTVSAESSVETQTNSMFFPLSRGFAASLAIEGISPTHGGHQVAQMLRKTVLPWKRENFTGCSFRSSRVQS